MLYMQSPASKFQSEASTSSSSIAQYFDGPAPDHEVHRINPKRNIAKGQEEEAGNLPAIMLRKNDFGSGTLPGNFPVTTAPRECCSTMAGAKASAMSHRRWILAVAGSAVASSVALSVRSTFKIAGSVAPACQYCTLHNLSLCPNLSYRCVYQNTPFWCAIDACSTMSNRPSLLFMQLHIYCFMRFC